MFSFAPKVVEHSISNKYNHVQDNINECPDEDIKLD